MSSIDSLRARRGACSAGVGIHSWGELVGTANPVDTEELETGQYSSQEINPDRLRIR